MPFRGHPAGHQAIVDTLREEIASGRFRPGQRLIEMELSQRFTLTRNKVREALRRLETDGFVTVTPNVGAMVSELSQKDIEHSYDLMGVLEGLSVREATPYVGPGHIEQLQVIIDQMEAITDPVEFYKLNDEFHALLAALSENERLIRFADNLRLHVRRFGHQVFYTARQIPVSRKDHRKIFEAIEEGRPEKAEQLVREHYLQTKNCHVKAIHKSL